ncbi:uncharacterized protein TRUGW13939_07400 [Talaromyces rugulosus]|uniref:Uncharacterized protein n=1 Tax=Talaromyces rugulosus TaxID=121627 RepID=A0A7H8R209_TALRU|nr:uncharacterized protein TRUGW13939_07400 [Talaromyces rugulosus]QKX60257.1 hypothetical protein TRUGW13939_07400 [Talaromyces rugulosus]
MTFTTEDASGRTYAFSYSTDDPNPEHIATKEVVLKNREALGDYYDEQQFGLEELTKERERCLDPEREAQMSWWLSDDFHKVAWISCEEKIQPKAATIDAINACKAAGVKFFFYWCHKQVDNLTPQLDTYMLIRSLILQAMRQYAEDEDIQTDGEDIQAKPQENEPRPFSGVLHENPVSLYKVANILFNILENIEGPIICIISDIEYLNLFYGQDTEDHIDFLRTFFNNLAKLNDPVDKKVRLCIISTLDSPFEFEPLSDIRTASDWGIKVV